MTAETVRTYCRLCEVNCGLVANVENGRLARLRPDRDHPVSKGFACSKGLKSGDMHLDPDRVRQPLKRLGDTFEPVTWDEALDEIAERLQTIIDRHGPNAVGLYLGNPNAFNALGGVAGVFFNAAIGTDRMFSATTQDCGNKYAVAELLYGTMSANPIPDLDRTDLLLLIGSNPRVSKSSFMSVPDPVRALKRISDRGGEVVFVNPLVIEPDIGETLQIRPDTDAYLLAAMIHEIDRTVGFRLGAMEGRVVGLDEVVSFVEPFTPSRVADVVGVSADQIATLARRFATADGASIHASTGLNMGTQGALAYWLVQMLLLVTGNMDRPGGNYLATRGIPMPPTRVDRTEASFLESRWGHYRPVVGMHPSALLSQFIDKEAAPVRALFVQAGNPALTVGGGDRLMKALASLDLLVTLDIYRNATGELADFVLPATDPYERQDINLFVQGMQSEPYLQWTPRVAEPDGLQREEWQIYADLLDRLGLSSLLTPELGDPLPTFFDPALSSFDLSIAALRDQGGVAVLPEPGPGGSFERRGIEMPFAAVPEAFRSTLDRAHALLKVHEAEGSGFRLITRRGRNTVNSTLNNVLSGRDDDDPTPLWIHPDDGRRLHLEPGDKATIRNDFGSIKARVRFDPNLRPGVVAMTHGFGNASTPGMPQAMKRPGVNVNALTPTGPDSFDAVSCMSQVTGIPVEVSGSAT